MSMPGQSVSVSVSLGLLPSGVGNNKKEILVHTISFNFQSSLFLRSSELTHRNGAQTTNETLLSILDLR